MAYQKLRYAKSKHCRLVPELREASFYSTRWDKVKGAYSAHYDPYLLRSEDFSKAHFVYFMQVLDSEYVVRLLDVFAQGLGFVLVFEFMASDLSEMIHNIDNPLTEAQVSVVVN